MKIIIFLLFCNLGNAQITRFELIEKGPTHLVYEIKVIEPINIDSINYDFYRYDDRTYVVPKDEIYAIVYESMLNVFNPAYYYHSGYRILKYKVAGDRTIFKMINQ